MAILALQGAHHIHVAWEAPHTALAHHEEVVGIQDLDLEQDILLVVDMENDPEVAVDSPAVEDMDYVLVGEDNHHMVVAVDMEVVVPNLHHSLD